MQVKGVDHVNIIANDVDATVKFYGDLLGFRRGDSPAKQMGSKGCWLLDSEDRAIIHLMAVNDEYHAGRDRGTTGSIDHVALVCEDFAGMIERCEMLGVEHKVNDRKYGDFRQIFVTDPNNVKLELNFNRG